MAVESLLGKLNSQALTKAVEKSTQSAAQMEQQGSNFKDVLSQVDSSGPEMLDMLGIGEKNIEPAAHMEAVSAETIDYAPGQEVTGTAAPDSSRKLVDMLSGVNKGQMQMDGLVNNILYSDKKFSNQELLVIQAHVFQWAQMTELTVKIAEHGVSSVKSVLNTQVQ